LAEPTKARRTLRGRVSLLGLAVIAGWVVVLIVVFNVLFDQGLRRDLDSVLRARAAATVETVKIDSAGNVSVDEQQTGKALDAGIWVYSGHRAVDRPPGGASLNKVADAIAAGAGGYRNGPGGYRLIGLPIMRGDARVGMVVAAASDATYERARTAAIVGSTVLALLMLLGAYPVLRIAAGRALRPVGEMTHRASDWSAHALNERFGADHRYAEIQSLAATLDEVLDRLAAVVRHERRLSAELSHELRTPLSAIVAETDLLLSREHAPEQVAVAHQAIHDSALAMERIMETLLSAARVDTQDAPGRCDLAPVVARLVHDHGRDRPAVAVDIAAGLGVGVDGPIVERILAPILSNARRYAQRSITVRARRKQNWVVIEVSDDGPGVAPDVRDEVFEPGRRGRNDDGHDGAGLGLALARRLARAAAGDVTLGAGSTFEIRLPPA
jgi:signal transduction histidine kinase